MENLWCNVWVTHSSRSSPRNIPLEVSTFPGKTIVLIHGLRLPHRYAFDRRCSFGRRPLSGGFFVFGFVGVSRAGGAQVSQQAEYLVLDEAEAHGNQSHARKDIGWTGAQRNVFCLLARQEVAKTDGSKAGEAEITTWKRKNNQYIALKTRLNCPRIHTIIPTNGDHAWNQENRNWKKHLLSS